jgi:hypothetical protein
VTTSELVYEVRPCKDKRGIDLIPCVLPFCGLITIAIGLLTVSTCLADVTVNLPRPKLRLAIIARLTKEGWTLTNSSARSLEFYREGNEEGYGSIASFKMTRHDGKTFVHGSGFRWGLADENDKPFHRKIDENLFDDFVRDAVKEVRTHEHKGEFREP